MVNFNQLFLTPAPVDGDIRTLFSEHFSMLAIEYNNSIDCKVHFIRTGELLEDWIFRPDVSKMSDQEKENEVNRLEQTKVSLPSFEVDSDAEFAKVVIETTLFLRPRLLGTDSNS